MLEGHLDPALDEPQPLGLLEGTRPVVPADVVRVPALGPLGDHCHTPIAFRHAEGVGRSPYRRPSGTWSRPWPGVGLPLAAPSAFPFGFSLAFSFGFSSRLAYR